MVGLGFFWRRKDFSTPLALNVMGFFHPEGVFDFRIFFRRDEVGGGLVDHRVSDRRPTGASLVPMMKQPYKSNF